MDDDGNSSAQLEASESTLAAPLSATLISNKEELLHVETGLPVQTVPTPDKNLSLPAIAYNPSLPRLGQLEVLKRSVYPTASCTQDAVVTSKDLFLETLKSLHDELYGSDLRVPEIATKPVDLHLLYAEVSSRGGHVHVSKDSLWKEVSERFDFPSTTSSTATLLGKCYEKELHHYEQVYLHGAGGQPIVSEPTSPFPGAPEAGVPLSDPEVSGDASPTESERPEKKRRRKRKGLMTVDPRQYVGSAVTGVINAKFDFGYFVTVVVGQHKFDGVLYHSPVNPAALACPAPDGSLPQLKQKRKRRTKEEMENDARIVAASEQQNTLQVPSFAGPGNGISRRPQGAITGGRGLGAAAGPGAMFARLAARGIGSGFNYFVKEWSPKIRQFMPRVSDHWLHLTIIERWNRATPQERKPYEVQEAKEKQRQESEMHAVPRRLSFEQEEGGGGQPNEVGPIESPSPAAAPQETT